MGLSVLVDGKEITVRCANMICRKIYSDMIGDDLWRGLHVMMAVEFNAIGQGTKDPGIAELATRYK